MSCCPSPTELRQLLEDFVTLLQLAGSQRTSFGTPDPNLKDLDQHGPLEELLT